MNLNSAKEILKKVARDYDAMAKEWDMTRFCPRPFHFNILKDIKKGDKILDAGCGNGVLYDVLASKSIDYTGMDISARLLRIAKKRANELKKNRRLNPLNACPERSRRIKFVKSNILKTPFKNGTFDWVFALAVLHHIPSKELQKQAVQEIYRVLKPGGRAAITVWNLFSDYAKKKFKIKGGRKDLIIPWKATPGKNIKRFIYKFAQKELIGLFKNAGFKKITAGYGNPDGKWLKSPKKGYFIILFAQK